MNKSAIALAVAAALTASVAAQAETTLYGSVRTSLDWNDPTGVDADWDVVNNASRLGVRGSEDLGNGLSAIYRYEFGVDSADTAAIGGAGLGGRLAFVGVKGGFGTVAIGRQWSPFYNALAKTDIFNGAISADGYYNNGGFTRRGSSLTWAAPSMGGLGMEAMVVADAGAEDTVDQWNVGLTYSMAGLGLGAGYSNNESTDVDTWGVAASGSFGGAYVAGLYMDHDGTNSYELAGEYAMGSNVLRASYGRVEDALGAGVDQDTWAVGLQHNLSKRSRVWVEYADREDDQENVSLGLRHDF